MLVKFWRIYAFSLLLQFWLRAEAWQAAPYVSNDASGRTTVSTYDARGNLVSLTDATGKPSRPGPPPAATGSLPGTAGSQTLPVPLAPITIHVPADVATIQAAINAANNGDTVLVSAGTYKENINFNGKAITVTSMNGAATTIIDGGAIDSVVTFRTSEGSGSVLNGFTITNGFSNFNKPNFGDGGGVFIGNASPTVTNNVITKNQACEGLGVFINGGSALIQGNVISSNTAAGCSGGIGGGGIAILAPSTAQIIGNTITNNIMTISGLNGGGLSLFAAGSPVLLNNIISNNTQFGIAMVNGSTPQVVQNLIINNTGGGITTSASGTGMLYLNNTIADNLGQTSFIANFGLASAIGGSFPTDAVLQNNLLIATPGQPAVFCSSALPAGFVANDVFSSGGTAFDPSCTSQTGSQGNVSSDPLFVDPAVDNYHLQTTSPAIDAGNSTTPIPLPTTDLDGNPRVFSATVDIGAFEFQGDTTTGYTATSLTFGPQQVGTSSPSQDFIISNGGSVALQLVPFTFTGNTADFMVTDNCHDSHGVLPGNGCTVFVTFSPTARFTRSEQINIVSNDLAGTKIISLTGTGTAPVVNLSSASLSFSNQLVGTNSSSQAVTLMNVGDGDLTITSIVASGDFSQTNNCGTGVGAGFSCSISVTFSPTQRGTRNGALTISDNAAGNPHVVTLQGNGIGPAATLSPNLTFTGQLVGTTSPPQPVTLSSTGETALTINNIAAGGDFAQTNNCPASLPNGQNCTIQVTFTPTARGTRSATLAVTDNSTTSPEQASLSGQGTAPVVALSRTALAFGNQVLDVPVNGTVILNNTGDAALSITSINAGGDFTQTNDCGTSVAAQGHCTVTLTFQPTALGPRLANLTFVDSAQDSPQSVALSGTGVQIGLSPSSLAFGNQVVGTTSATQMVTVTNTGNSALSITSIVPSSGFTQSNNCGASLAGNASCTLAIAFAPSAIGLVNGLITVSYNGTQSTIVVSGTGAQIGLSPSSLAFGNQVVGTTSATQMVTITNTGNSTLSITGVVPSSGFTQSNNCGTSLAGSASCTLTIAFAPTAAGPVNGLITVSYSGTQITIAVSGNGTDFNLGPQSGGTTATVSAGGTATYNLSASGTAGFSGSATLSCTGAPALASCSVNPSSVTLNGTTPQSFTVSVTTTARASVSPPIGNLPTRWLPPQLLMAATLVLLFMAWERLLRRRPRLAILRVGVGALLLAAAGCGGGGGGSKTPVMGTPAGTYTITITATSASVNRTLNLTLNVN
jgi:parallel beta-helix repeat protein/YD repeat-containing protein